MIFGTDDELSRHLVEREPQIKHLTREQNGYYLKKSEQKTKTKEKMEKLTSEFQLICNLRRNMYVYYT